MPIEVLHMNPVCVELLIQEPRPYGEPDRSRNQEIKLTDIAELPCLGNNALKKIRACYGRGYLVLFCFRGCGRWFAFVERSHHEGFGPDMVCVFGPYIVGEEAPPSCDEAAQLETEGWIARRLRLHSDDGKVFRLPEAGPIAA